MNPTEDNQERNKHVCKFCSKSFPCGRSLGGHMRSHVINASAEIDEKLVATTTKKPSSPDNTGTGSEAAGTTNSAAYGLRENPKKTWRFTGSSEETLFLDKFCRECGKGFYSWKALFGHMKCHSSEKERVSNNISNNSLEYDQDSSWTNSASQKLVLDSQSDNEATAPNRRRRSKRRRTRHMAPAATSSVSDAEQEQEEVAMSLMMLSRHVGPWGGLNSVAESSVKNNKKLDSEPAKVTKLRDKKLEFGNLVSSNLNSRGKSSEILATESANGVEMINKTTVSINGFVKNGKDKNSQVDSESALEVNGEGLVLSKSACTNNKYTSIKAKFLDSESKSNSLRNWVNKPSGAEFSKSSQKRGKFECTTCNKIFHSYQALGGHRASHKKIKGCFASRNESSENSIEFEADPSTEPTTESKHMKNSDNNEYLAGHEVGTGFDNEAVADTESKKSKRHECPICLKVFASGQALGGHKRSHLAGGSESSRSCQSQTVVLQETVPEIRDFLDLNLPASTEEESNGHTEPYRPWWVVGGNNHKQEALVGLMSN